MDTYDLIKRDNMWKFQKEGSNRVIKIFDTKEEGKNFSIKYMREHGGSLRIRNENGQIQEERIYPRRSDPYLPKG